MEYCVIINESVGVLTERVQKMIEKGWKPVGSHVVSIDRTAVHGFETIYHNLYSQTLVKEN